MPMTPPITAKAKLASIGHHEVRKSAIGGVGLLALSFHFQGTGSAGEEKSDFKSLSPATPFPPSSFASDLPAANAIGVN